MSMERYVFTMLQPQLEVVVDFPVKNQNPSADGRWDAAYAGQRSMTVPDDLRDALAHNARARAFFETLDSRNRYAILYRIHDAKKPETRRARIEKFVAMLAEHRTLHP